MAETAQDFPAERVVDLDGDAANNFMVLKEGVRQAAAGPEENRLLSADETAQIYTFEKAGGEISALQPGDLFYYSDPENPQTMIVIKVGEIRTEGDTVTLAAQETGVSEIFDYVKVDTSGETQDFVMEEGTSDPGVTYLGDVDYEPEVYSENTARRPLVPDRGRKLHREDQKV